MLERGENLALGWMTIVLVALLNGFLLLGLGFLLLGRSLGLLGAVGATSG